MLVYLHYEEKYFNIYWMIDWLLSWAFKKSLKIPKG